MSRARLALALGLTLLTTPARGDEAIPGHTVVLDHGHDPAAPSTMPGGPRRDARLVYPLPITAPTARQLAPLAGVRLRGPTIDAEGRIFVGTSEGLRIVSPDGSRSDLVLDVPVEATPVLLPGGDVIVINQDGLVTRVSPEGHVRGRAFTGSVVHFAPLVEPDGTLATTAASRMLAVVDAEPALRETLALSDGLALGATRTSRGHWAIAAGDTLFIVDPSTLTIERQLTLPGRAVTPAACADDGALWIATVDGELVRVRGELRVTRVFALGVRLLDAAADRAMLGIAPGGDVLIVAPARGLVRITADGQERWTFTGDTPLVHALSIDEDGRAAVVDRLGHLTVLDADGAVLWTLALESLPLGPAITTAQGRIVIVTERGVVLLGPT